MAGSISKPLVHVGPPLTMPKIKALPKGTWILVTWAAAPEAPRHGPHLYQLEFDAYGRPQAVKKGRKANFSRPLSWVGPEPHTTVTVYDQSAITISDDEDTQPLTIDHDRMQEAHREAQLSRNAPVSEAHMRIEAPPLLPSNPTRKPGPRSELGKSGKGPAPFTIKRKKGDKNAALCAVPTCDKPVMRLLWDGGKQVNSTLCTEHHQAFVSGRLRPGDTRVLPTYSEENEKSRQSNSRRPKLRD
jgi:hypothetical protein